VKLYNSSANKTSFLAFFVGFLLLTACTKEVNIDLPGYEEQLVVDGRIDVDGFPLVILSRSKDVYAPTDVSSFLGAFVYDATVSVSDGQQEIQLELFSVAELPQATRERLAEMLEVELDEVLLLPIQVYSTANPVIIGQEGKTYQLKILDMGKTYTSTTTLLPPVALDNLYWKPDDIFPEFGICWARLSDPMNVKNAYKWEVKLITPQPNNEPKDNLFRSGNDPHFSDQFFDGLTFEFDTRYPKKDTTYPEDYRKHYKFGDLVVVKLSRIDPNVFEFFDKKSAQMESGNSPFATPVNIPTNITGGALGIWAGYSPWYDTLYCVP
jgi:hypothetical protein